MHSFSKSERFGVKRVDVFHLVLSYIVCDRNKVGIGKSGVGRRVSPGSRRVVFGNLKNRLPSSGLQVPHRQGPSSGVGFRLNSTTFIYRVHGVDVHPLTTPVVTHLLIDLLMSNTTQETSFYCSVTFLFYSSPGSTSSHQHHPERLLHCGNLHF